jgi:hypothetical protein
MKWTVMIAGTTILLFSVGCAGLGPLEMDYGNSHRLAKVNQILNPDAQRNLEPVTGFDGRTAQAVMQTYRESFERAAPASGFVPIFSTRGIGTGMGSGYK